MSNLTKSVYSKNTAKVLFIRRGDSDQQESGREQNLRMKN